MKFISFIFFSLIWASGFTETAFQDSGVLHIKKTTDFEINGKGDSKHWSQTSFVHLTHRKGNKHYASTFKMLYSENGV